MNCPVCHNVRMREVMKDDVLIDICPECKGVWLDRGELDKLMAGIRELRPQLDNWNNDERNRQPRRDHDDDDHYDKHYKQGQGHHKKKRNVLDVFGDLFD